MCRFELRKATTTVFSLCIGLCVLAAASIASAQTPAAMELLNDTDIVMQDRAARIDSSGADMEKGSWREDIPQDGTCIDSAFMKSLGDPQAWACFGQEYDLLTPDFYVTGAGPGGGRGIGFQADSDFKLNAVSIMGDLVAQEFEVVIYASTDGHTAGSVLATFSATVGGTGTGWNTVPVAFDCEEGDFYVVNWRPATPSNTWVNSLDYYWDTGLPDTIGPLTVLEGYEGADASPSNPLHNNFKFLTGADCYCEDNDLATPNYVGNSGGEGSGRAIGFRADRDFRLNAVSIKATLIEQSFDVVIHESTDGHTAGSVLATFSSTTGGTGFDWNVVPVSFKFKNGYYYVVNWRPTSPGAWADSFDAYFDSGLPYTTGPVTIVEGFEGGSPNASNLWHPHFSFCISGDSTVALLAAEQIDTLLRINDVREKLIDTGFFAQVDVFNVANETPTLAELQAYAAVLVYSATGFSNAATLGDNLADYVDSGGGVVTAVFSNASIPIGGRFDTDNYWAIAPSSQQSSAAFLGAIWAPGHPILDGVATFNGGSGGWRPTTTTIQSGATRVADWTDGTPLVATKKYGTARRVDLGFYPPSSDARSDFWDSGTDGARLMANALKWVRTCSDCDIENFSDPLAQWQNRWLFLNSNIENYYVARGTSCDPGHRGNQPEGLWISDDPGCSNLVTQSPVRINFSNGYGDEANSFSLDHYTCFAGVTINVFDKDGVLVASDPLAGNCWNWSHYSVNLSNGISAFEYAYTGSPVEGGTSVDNVQLRFSLFRDGFESIDVSEWSAVRP